MAARSTPLAREVAERLRRSRAAAQLLHRPGAPSAEAVVEHLLAIQAQNLRATRLAVRARTTAASASDVDAALDDGALVVTWLARGTLHMVRADDYPWLLGLTAPAGAAQGRRRLAQEGVPPDDAERGIAAIERGLADGPLTRAELAERVAAAGVASEGQAMPNLLALAARRGIAVRGPIRGADQAFVLTRDWLGIEPPGELGGDERERALADLARRYLAGHGPASAADLAAWAGLGLRDAGTGFTAIAAELAAIEGEPAEPPRGGHALFDLADRDRQHEPIPARLLGPFDPYMLGWKDRGFAVPAEYAKRVHPGGGMLRAAITVDGLAVGTWRIERGTISLEPFDGIDADLGEEIAEIARFGRSSRT